MLCAAIPAQGGGLTLALPGVVAAHQVTWKFTYASFVKNDLLGEPFDSLHVYRSINYRLRERLAGYIFKANLDSALAEGAGRSPRNRTALANEVAPLTDEDLNILPPHLKPKTPNPTRTTRAP